jgi:mono/diheme cytochrome c family protein
VDFCFEVMVRFTSQAAAGAAAFFVWGVMGCAVAQAPQSPPVPTPTPVLPAAQPAPSSAEQAALIETGRRTYVTFCTRCHGVNLVTTGGIGPDLRKFPADGRERFTSAVLKGVRAMPAWDGTIKPEQVDAIWAYVGSVNGW